MLWLLIMNLRYNPTNAIVGGVGNKISNNNQKWDLQVTIL